MTAAEQIKKYLNKNHVSYQITQHNIAYTATEVARAQHIPGKQMIKSVIVKADNRNIMCVLCSTHLINFTKLKKILNVEDLYLANENEIKSLFPNFEVGAEPPFGDLFGLEVYIDRTVSENDDIVFNAGTHTETIKMRYTDFANLVNAKTENFAQHI